MTPKILTRRAAESDAEAIVEFNRAMARETEGKELDLAVISAGVAALLKNSCGGFYLVAEIGGQVVGGLMVTTEWSDWRNGVFWWIQSVYVRPTHRRQGIYRKLYESVQRLAAKEGNVCGFRLYVEKNNLVAQKTYQTLGMRETHYKVFEELSHSRHRPDHAF